MEFETDPLRHMKVRFGWRELLVSVLFGVGLVVIGVILEPFFESGVSPADRLEAVDHRDAQGREGGHGL